MKCKRRDCFNEATVLNQVYCSADCAPYGHMKDAGYHGNLAVKKRTIARQKTAEERNAKQKRKRAPRVNSKYGVEK